MYAFGLHMLQNRMRLASQTTVIVFSLNVLLQRLDVGNNRFAGKFNQLLGSLSFLISFSAERNMLSGTLPPTMASLGLKVCQQPTHHC